MTRLELANQLIEGQPAFHFAFIPVIVVRVERFAPHTKLILSQPPLPIGLHARKEICFGTRGGIRTHTVQILNLSSPAGWTTRAKALPIFDCQLPICSLDQVSLLKTHQSEIGI